MLTMTIYVSGLLEQNFLITQKH